MKFKLDENLSPALAHLFFVITKDVHSVLDQALGGHSDRSIIDTCRREGRVLVTLDLDFANILSYPPSDYTGIAVLRLRSQAHANVEAAIRQMVKLLSIETLERNLWVVEENQVRIHG